MEKDLGGNATGRLGSFAGLRPPLVAPRIIGRRNRRRWRLSGDTCASRHARRRGALHRYARRAGGRRSMMPREGRLLVIGGLLLAVWGMTYGLYYAVFVEHQTLDTIGGSLAGAFVHAAEQAAHQTQAPRQASPSANYIFFRP